MGLIGHLMRCVGRKTCRRSKGDTCWWNHEVKLAILGRNDAHLAMYGNSTENRNRYKSMMNEARKTVSKLFKWNV